MKFRFLTKFMLVFCAVMLWAQSAAAQETSISESQFWERLNQTEVLLRQLPSEADPASRIGQIELLWEGIAEVRLDGGSVTVDLGWIRTALADGQPETLAALHQQVKALISYHDNQVRQSGQDVSVTPLAAVLQDPRFQYPDDVTPTPIPEEIPQPEETVSSSSADTSSLPQIILIVAGIAVVIVIFTYFARNLQVQGASLDAVPNDDPTTSDDAQNMATENAQSQDYRSAIRYLYLASLLMLDERGVIHYNSSLTNREHLQHLRDRPQVQDLLRQVVNAFEEVWYGYLSVDEAYYQHFRQQVDELNRIVA